MNNMVLLRKPFGGDRMSKETDKIAKEAWGVAKILFIGKYAFQILFGLLFLFFVGWFLLDMAWSWFMGLF